MAMVVAGLVVMGTAVQAQDLTRETASRFAKHVLASVVREYPNKLDHILGSDGDVKSPRALHPAFYGCFDWHSSVHGHWMLIRLLKTYPDLPEADAIRKIMDEQLSTEAIRQETAYFTAPANRGFERTYGWAWLLKLGAELRSWDSPEARRWSAQLQPLTDAVSQAFQTYLPKLTYPNRTGIHPNTAFSLDLALDYARVAKDGALEKVVLDRARAYYLKDTRGPIAWEPGGEDFLSPCLEEAALMAKVMEPAAFRTWVVAFLPDLMKTGLLQPAVVSDRTDPRIVHLDGLNLSRARCLHVLAESLPAKDARRKALERASLEHAEAALPHVVSGNYEGDHWLASFAVRLLEERRVR
jgi:hypothetical protein